MSKSFQYRRRVEFRDTDMAGIVHFSVFFTYMEQAEHEFLRSIELGVFSELDGEQISWPRVAAQCNYHSAIKFGEELNVHVSIQRLGNKSVTYEHKIYSDQTLVADGTVTSVCCRIAPNAKPEAVQIPPVFIQRLQPFVIANGD